MIAEVQILLMPLAVCILLAFIGWKLCTRLARVEFADRPLLTAILVVLCLLVLGGIGTGEGVVEFVVDIIGAVVLLALLAAGVLCLVWISRRRSRGGTAGTPHQRSRRDRDRWGDH